MYEVLTYTLGTIETSEEKWNLETISIFDQMSNMELSGVVVTTGLIVMFIALTSLVVVVALMSKITAYFENKPNNKSKGDVIPETPKKPATPKPEIQKAVVVEEASTQGISNETIAAISAGVAVMMDGAPVRISSIKRVKETRPVWNYAGVLDNTRPF